MDKKICDHKVLAENCIPLIKHYVNQNQNQNKPMTIKGRTVYNSTHLLLNIVFLLLSLMTFILLNCTNIYNRVLIEKIVLYNNSEMLEYWAHPPVDIIIKVHVFNYTNIFQVLNGTEKKIKLDEVGPYVYREHIEKTQLVFEDNKITFNENRSHIFLPELSGNFREDDVVIVPNLPLVSGIPNVKSLGFFAEIGFKTILAATKPREFHNLTISKYFMGYNDDFMNVISKIKWDFNPNDVGILAPRRGMTKKNITVFSGTTDVNTVGETFALGGKTMLDVWKTKDCNKVGGSDGVIYGPKSVQNKENLQVYLPEFCRSLPLVFNKEERTEEGYRAYRYIAPQGSFSTSKPHLENEFYCELKNTKEKQIDGVLDVSGCIDGTPPIFISHPHFMEGSEELFSNFEGLKPNVTLHNSYAYIHPRLSVPLHGISRMQLNIKLNHLGNLYKNLPDNIILPLAWIETTTDKLPAEIKTRLFLSTVVVDFIESFLKIFSLVVFFMSSFTLIYCNRNILKHLAKFMRKTFDFPVSVSV